MNTEGMATYSNILAWRIPWMVESGWLQSKGSQRIVQNWTAQHAHMYTFLKLLNLHENLYNIGISFHYLKVGLNLG